MIYAVMSQKGGSGKTTVSVNLAAALANKKKKVLLVDADQQANSTYTLGVDSVQYSLVDVFKGKCKVAAAIIPGKIDLLTVTSEIMGQSVKPDAFKKALAGLSYDYVIIDCPPGFTEVTKAVILAADRIILPVNMDVYGLQSISQFSGIYEQAKEVNKGLKVSGIVRCKYQTRRNITKQVDKMLEEGAKYLGTKIYKSALRECLAVRESALFRKSIFDYAPKSTAAADFEEFTKEIMKERK